MDTGRREVPGDRHYEAAHHLWVKRGSGTTVQVGIDALGLESLGELAFLGLPEVGAQVSRGEPMGTLEAAKMTSPLVAPVSGTVVARNGAVLRDPTAVNRDCYGDGWLVEVESSSWEQESAVLISGDAIPAWVEAETERYRSEGWID